MNLRQELRREHRQKQVISPLMRQSLQILRMPVMELRSYVEHQVETNPVMEEMDAEEFPGDEPGRVEDARAAAGEEDWEDYYRSMSHAALAEDEEGADASAESMLACKPDLRSFLVSQLNLSDCEDREIGEFIIANIDSDGYLRVSAEEAASALNVCPGRVESALKHIHSFDPPGVGARDLRECILIQMGQQEKKNRVAEQIVSGCFAELRARKISFIAEKLGTGAAEVEEALKFISGFNPRPGASFSSDAAPAVIPDVSVKKVGGKHEILFEDEWFPRLRISGFYRNLLKRPIPAETREYVNGRIKSARWLINAVGRRNITIRRVVEQIVKTQSGFLDGTGSGILPLKLEDVAGETGLDVSTVSRVVSGKYIETDRGIFPLKYFFSGGVGAGVKTASSRSVKERIKEIIGGEDPFSPLSDSRVARILGGEGASVARRTVAKYRDEAGILPARLRKKYAGGAT